MRIQIVIRIFPGLCTVFIGHSLCQYFSVTVQYFSPDYTLGEKILTYVIRAVDHFFAFHYIEVYHISNHHKEQCYKHICHSGKFLVGHLLFLSFFLFARLLLFSCPSF